MPKQIETPDETGLAGTGRSRADANPFGWLRQEVDHLFDEFFNHQQRRLLTWPDLSMNRIPSIDLEDRGKDFCLTVELPGYNSEDVSVELRDGSLHLSATHEESKNEKSETMLLCERRSGQLERVVPLPQAVDIAKAEAQLKQGVLTVTLPKLEAAVSTTRSIPVNG